VSRLQLRICIDVNDIEHAITFYTDGVGLVLGRRLLANWAELLGGPCPIDLLCNAAGTAPLGESRPQRRDYARHWTPVHLDFVVDDIEAATQRLVAHGATLEQPIQDRVWGRMASLADPFGHGIDVLEFRGRGYDEILAAGSETAT
jgi:predicted enzyme related to lactoylglutathione lyase